ncbi:MULTISPECIES: ArsR/SmtB family transcription factor [Branchiibius]|nr:helix-turn-helix domain-containing protein [Branchiibius hedensis]
MGLVFKALSSPQRLRILILLRDGPRTEPELCAALDLGTIEAHLQTLLRAGLIVRHKHGVAPKNYTLAEGVTAQLTELLEKFRA